MELSEDVFVMGQLVDYKSGIFGTTTGLVERFGRERVRDFPVAENIMTHSAMGAALTGMRPVLVHQRLDFMMYSLDAIVNWMALWHFKSNGKSQLPVTIRAIVGKGWGQAAQHSKSLQAWFAHLPGLRVAMPATAHDAKGLLLESIFGETPAVIIEHRSLYSQTDVVPVEPYRVRFGAALVRRPGRDGTIVAVGAMVPLSLRVAELLRDDGRELEVVDVRTLAPLDTATICASVARTGRLVVADMAWRSFGAGAEIVTRVCEHVGDRLKARPLRIGLPDSHTPMSSALERQYYVDEGQMAAAIRGAWESRP
jgi:pyruvate dehydrogenase E1 component beta subunit